MKNWTCTDNVLCSYRTIINGLEYRAQRTYSDSVSVWYEAEKIGTAPSPRTWREDAWDIAANHSKHKEKQHDNGNF